MAATGRYVQNFRTATTNAAPANNSLAPGQISFEMASTPVKMWLGVDPAINSTGRRLVIDSSIYLPLTGGGLSGPLVLAGDATGDLNPIPLRQLGSLLGFTISSTAPPAPFEGQLWLNSTTGQMMVWQGAWVSQTQGYLPLSGGILSYNLGLHGGANLSWNATSVQIGRWDYIQTTPYPAATAAILPGGDWALSVAPAGTGLNIPFQIAISVAPNANVSILKNLVVYGQLSSASSGPDGIILNKPANTDNWVHYTGGSQEWQIGVSGTASPGHFWIYNVTQSALRAGIDLLGGFFINSNSATPLQLTQTTATADNFITYAGGARSWRAGVQANGQYWLYDATGSSLKLSVAADGLVGVSHSNVDGVQLTQTSATADNWVNYLGGARNWRAGVQANGAYWIYDVTGSRLGFAIAPDGAVTASNTLNINAGGASITGTVAIRSGAQFIHPSVRQWGITAASNGELWFTDDTASFWAISITPGTTGQVRVTNLVAVSSWTPPSDIQLKDDVQPYTHGLDVVLQVDPKSWLWNGKAGTTADGRRHFGFVANDIEDIVPEFVGAIDMELERGNPATSTPIKTFNEIDLIPALVNSVKQIIDRLNALEGSEEVRHGRSRRSQPRERVVRRDG